jgi:hypothetical protein
MSYNKYPPEPGCGFWIIGSAVIWALGIALLWWLFG